MSMISAQIDELRKWADQLSERENEFGVVVRALVAALRRAADTIWELRDDLQRANVENATLRQQLADVTESMGRVEERCAKLRELCADMGMCLTWQWEPHGYMMDGCDHCRFKGKTGGMCGLGMFRGRMRELGVEVD